MGDVFLSSVDQYGELVLEETGNGSKNRHSSELDHICTYNFTSKADAWAEADEDVVNGLLLREIDFLTQPPYLPALDTLSTHVTLISDEPSLNTINSSLSSQPADCLSHHPLSWVWENYLNLSPSSTPTPDDNLANNFDLLPYSVDCADTLLQQVGITDTAEQFPESERAKEFEEGDPRRSYSHSYDEPEIYEGHPEREFRKSYRHECETDRSYEHQSSGNSCGLFQDSKRSEVVAIPSDDVTEAEGQFTKIRDRASIPDRENERESQDMISTDAASSTKSVQRLSRREVSEPKRPKNGFIRYSVRHRAELSRQYPYKDNRSISKMLGIRWKKLTPEEKRPYQEEFTKDIHKIRSQNPLWRYAPARKLTHELVDPMSSRLRPRDKIRPRIPDPMNSDWDWESSWDRDNPRSHVNDRQSPLQHSATSWKQCDICSLWRPLPGHLELEDLPQTWSCAMNPDHRFNLCGIKATPFPIIPSMKHFHQSQVTPALMWQGRSHQSAVSNQHISMPHSVVSCQCNSVPHQSVVSRQSITMPHQSVVCRQSITVPPQSVIRSQHVSMSQSADNRQSISTFCQSLVDSSHVSMPQSVVSCQSITVPPQSVVGSQHVSKPHAVVNSQCISMPHQSVDSSPHVIMPHQSLVNNHCVIVPCQPVVGSLNVNVPLSVICSEHASSVCSQKPTCKLASTNSQQSAYQLASASSQQSGYQLASIHRQQSAYQFASTHNQQSAYQLASIYYQQSAYQHAPTHNQQLAYQPASTHCQ